MKSESNTKANKLKTSRDSQNKPNVNVRDL